MSPSTAFVRFRAPGLPLDVESLLSRVWPASRPEDRAGLVSRGAVAAGGRELRALQTRIAPGEAVALREPFGPAPSLPDAGKPRCRAIVPALPWCAGVLARRRGMRGAVRFARVEGRDGLQLLELVAAADDAPAERFLRDALLALAAAGHPVLADTLHGGILVDGGLRLAAGDGSPAWPDEPVFPGLPPASPLPALRVSRATRRVLARGHPWILRDDETGDASRFAAGTPVRIEAPDGAELGVAHVEGPDRLTARMWTRPRRSRGNDTVEARVAAALRRRRPLLEASGGARSDVFRLLHGEGDDLPGLFVDRLGAVLRVLVTSPGTDAYRDRALDALLRGVGDRLGGEPSLVEVVHLRERPAGELCCTRLLRGPVPGGSLAASERLPVREAGVGFLVDPGLSRPTRSSPGFGLYPDQRDNRARLLAGARPGGRLLNLFAHTGAFSVAWLAGPGAEAVSVDLSGAYLRWLEENLALNGIAPEAHRSVRLDGRRFLETCHRGERFDAIVVDPPTAAAAGRRFWSVARDLPPLLEQALRHLAPGGRLLVSRNDRRRGGLRELVAEAARRAGVRLDTIEDAPPGADFPAREGFPEGDPFSGVLASRA